MISGNLSKLMAGNLSQLIAGNLSQLIACITYLKQPGTYPAFEWRCLSFQHLNSTLSSPGREIERERKEEGEDD